MIKPLLTSTIDGGRAQLLGTFNAVPDDKLSWKPLDLGRSALNAFSDAAMTAGFAAKIIETRGELEISPETFGQMRADSALWSREDALSALETNHATLLSAIENCPDAEFSTPITLSLGGGMTLPLAGWAMMSYRTYISRFAQINYIQTLYGDTESH